MSVQNISAPARADRDISATQSMVIGGILALVLIVVSQGTTVPTGVEDWHGNVAVSSAR